MAHEVGAVADRVGHEDGMLLEVDVVDGRIRRESGPLQDLELEAVAERPLTAPGGAAAHHAAVHEDDPRALCPAPPRLRVWDRAFHTLWRNGGSM